MPPKPKHQLCGDRPVAARQFTDRESFLAAFKVALAEKVSNPKEQRVFVLYGIGGIGKTRLRKELMQGLAAAQPELPMAVLDFAEPSLREPDAALASLRQSLGREHGVDFRRFDIAYAVYWKLARPTTPMSAATIPFYDESSLVANAASILTSVPIVGLLPALARAYAKGEAKLVEWLTKRGQSELAALCRMKEPAEVREWLPAFWAADVREHLEKAGGTAVVCIDTFEALVQAERAEGRVHELEAWVRELVAQLPEALWVICGREKLRWDEADSDWRGCLSQHLVGGLAEADCDRFLQSCGVPDASVRRAIIAGSKGVPFYLDLAVDTYEEIAAAGGTPGPEDFGEQPRELFVRFLRHLGDVESETLKVLAVPRFFDRDLFKLLLTEFRTGYPVTAFDRLCRFSFINEGALPGSYTMHQLMRESLLAYTESELVRRVHRWLFDRYSAQVQDLDVKNITPVHAAALVEAFHHGKAVLTANELYNWYWKPARRFTDAALWGEVLPQYRELAASLESELGPSDPKVASCLNNLAGLLESQGKYTEAEPLYRRALEMREKALPEGHPDIATSLNNLAGLLAFQGKYTEAEPLYRRALEIDEKALPEGHPSIATGLNNLAGLLYAQSRYAEAEPLYRRALEIVEKALGVDHPSTRIVRGNLEHLLKKKGETM